jgi:hypothetical protein
MSEHETALVIIARYSEYTEFQGNQGDPDNISTKQIHEAISKGVCGENKS